MKTKTDLQREGEEKVQVHRGMGSLLNVRDTGRSSKTRRKIQKERFEKSGKKKEGGQISSELRRTTHALRFIRGDKEKKKNRADGRATGEE